MSETKGIRALILTLILLACAVRGAVGQAEMFDFAPRQPTGVRALAISTSSLRIAWNGVNSATGYRVYFGLEPDAELYGEYDASARQATLNGLQSGTLYYVYVTAFNADGESAMDEAVRIAEVIEGEALIKTRLTLDCPRLILLSQGAARTLTVSGASNIAWEATTGGAVSIAPNGASCVVTGMTAGTATVSATHASGASASVTVTVVDTGDLSGGNLTEVQQRLARHEDMLESDAGGEVIWEMISGLLSRANLPEARVQAIVERVRSAAALYRDLYVFAFGSYAVSGEATSDVSGSYYAPEENALYMQPSNAADERYAYTFLHETGHAIDYNAGIAGVPSSLNSHVTESILQDVRDNLNARIEDAAARAEVAEGAYNADRVVDAVLNQRELLHHDEVMSTLTDAEQAVYAQLTDSVKSEMNRTLPRNNGVMVWDAIEGATNFAISGSFGHAYLFNDPAYRQMAYYYYYDRKGNPHITVEPWAEFFSAQVMGDQETIQVNESWLTKTCKYFAETLAPTLLDALKGAVLAAA